MKVAFYERGYEDEAATGSNPMNYIIFMKLHSSANLGMLSKVARPRPRMPVRQTTT